MFTTLCSPSFKVIELADSTKLLSASVTVTFISFFALLILSTTVTVAIPTAIEFITTSFFSFNEARTIFLLSLSTSYFPFPEVIFTILLSPFLRLRVSAERINLLASLLKSKSFSYKFQLFISSLYSLRSPRVSYSI